MYDADPPLPSHPFIDFAGFDPGKLTPRSWVLLGETFSKCQHLARAPLSPPVAREMGAVYLASGVAATVNIEGNPLTPEQVRKVMEEGTANIPESRAYQEQEVRNLAAAISTIREALIDGRRVPVTVEHLCRLNDQVLKDVPEEGVIPGDVRSEGRDVSVGRYIPPPGREVPDLVKLFQEWLARLRDVPETAAPEDRFVATVLAAVLGHLYIAWIHPFDNGNGRVARLVETQILAESGVVPLVSTQLLSNHFNLTRDEYYRELNEARTGPETFIRYALQGFADGLRSQIEAVQGQNLEIVWQSFVFERFDRLPGTTARTRQRKLALALPDDDQGVTPEKAQDLTPWLTRAYAKHEGRLPSRDLGQLVELGLAERVGRRRYRAMRELILAFVPPMFGD